LNIKKVLIVTAFAMLALVSPTFVLAQSDREIDCNGVCEALGLSPSQCWEYIHNWHDSRNKCTNWSATLDISPDQHDQINGLGECDRDFTGEGRGGFNCRNIDAPISGPIATCEFSGVIVCGNQPRSYRLACNGGPGGQSIPRVTVEEDQAACTSTESGETRGVYCDHAAGVLRYWNY
jgi:hypothetical protein